MDGRVIGASAGISTYDGDAVAADILYGKKAVVNNVLLTGTMRPTQFLSVGAQTSYTGTTDHYIGLLISSITYPGSYTFYWDALADTYNGYYSLYLNGVKVEASEQEIAAGAKTRLTYTMTCASGDEVRVYGRTGTSGGTIYGPNLLIAVAS